LELNKEAYENQIKILTPLFETPDMTPKQKKKKSTKNKQNSFHEKLL